MLYEELEHLFKDCKQFKSRYEIFERMVKKIEKRQKELLDDLHDHSAGDKSFVIGASYLLDVCSRAVELFDIECTKLEQKRYLIDFILSSATLDGENCNLHLRNRLKRSSHYQKLGNGTPCRIRRLLTAYAVRSPA
ncbi:hypothetical protein IPL68_00765 [Candidatus Saccharibacteria bacterium]|nr:MAG: hypothetical protein IPL68_00765 [Candidatus Saccharibacteria bacterium]